jgi:hypothetical protein
VGGYTETFNLIRVTPSVITLNVSGLENRG